MSKITTGLPDGTPRGAPEYPERRSFTHKRLERWIRLQQFVYGLPDDYAYAVRSLERGGVAESHALVTVGWMTWFGSAKGTDRQHSLALALLEASEALSANGTRAFLHEVSRWVWSRLRPARVVSPAREAPPAEDQRLAG